MPPSYHAGRGWRPPGASRYLRDMEAAPPDRVGFFCAYTPLPLLDAAGLAPHRLLPHGDWPDEAGAVLHGPARTLMAV